MMAAWTLISYQDYEKPKKQFNKKYREEMFAIAANLKTVVKAVENGSNLEQLKSLGFVHSEPLGIIAIDERGCEKRTKPKALRLYLFIDSVAHEIHVMLLGDKATKSGDILICKRSVQKLFDDRAPPPKRGFSEQH